jgi:ABC-2 type transport system ATP-binding protein
LEDVEKVCDRIGLLEKGVLVLEDTIENIQENYFNSRMFIETDKSANDMYTYLKEKGVKNNIEMNHKGIICDVKSETTAHEILELLVKDNIKVIEFRRLNATLEDVFVRVTSEETT